MQNLITMLFTTPQDASTAGHPAVFHYYLVWIIFCAGTLLVWFYYQVEGRKRFVGGHALHKYMGDRILNQFALAALVGPVLMFGRWAMDASLFSWRIWRYLWVLWLVAIVVYWIVFMVRTYPAAIARHRQERLKAQYMPQPKSKKDKRTARAGAR